MIWATVSSQSCFCFLYRTSPSLTAKNIINLISELTIQWCSCVVFSCVNGTGCLLWRVCSLGKTLLAFALLHFVPQGQTCQFPQVFLDFLLLHSSPLQWKGYLSWLLVLLNGLPWKQTEIILSFLRLHPRTAFWTLLLTMMTTSFLLRDSCPP